MNLPSGYRYSSVYAGIRKVKKDDVALIVSDAPAAAAAVFTQNRVQAAPVKLARTNLKASRGTARAVIVNAGNANCATRTGDKVAAATCRAVAKALKAKPEEVIPASTGVIGVELDPKLIANALPRLVSRLRADRFEDAANAILTTDLRQKVAYALVPMRRGTVRIAGMTKGSGMIHPQMATTLGFILTDAALSASQLRPMLVSAANESYNRLSVDGDTSTNDTLLVLANGACGFKLDPNDRAVFAQALTELAQSLAQQIARDGEGARKFVLIDVNGAPSEDDAARIARSIANSPLVKTAIAGSDPNWGRILSAAGNAGVVFDPADVQIDMQGVKVCRQGLAAKFSEDELKKKLDEPECRIRLTIAGGGTGKARFWTCDLTEKYIEINASYRT